MSNKKCVLCDSLGTDFCTKLKKELHGELSKTIGTVFKKQIEDTSNILNDSNLSESQKSKVIVELGSDQLRSLSSLAASYAVYSGIDLGSFVAFIIDEYQLWQQNCVDKKSLQSIIDETLIHQAAKRGGQA